MKIAMTERITIERLRLEQKKLETEEKIVTIKERDKLTVKQPKLGLKKYDGHILKWTEFWNAFEATINKNLHDIEKFNYLRGQLQEPAGERLFGLELMKNNYKIVGDMLKEQYGKKHVIIDAHCAKIMNVPVATYKSTSLRSFYDITEKHLRCLRSLDIQSTKECVTWAGEDKTWKWRIDCKNLPKTPEKTHRSSRSLRHRDEVVSQARWITKTSIYLKDSTSSSNKLAKHYLRKSIVKWRIPI